MSNAIIKYQAMQGEVELSPQIVKQYLVNGDADKVTDQEVHFFMELCKYQQLNPFIKEAHLIKYGTQAAQIVVAYDVFIARAEQHDQYKGYKSGVIVLDKNNEIVYRTGALRLSGEEVVGGWCEVFRDDYKEPVRVEVSFEEYAGYKKDGELNINWKTKPAFMITKVAEGQAHRKAFPNKFKGLYLEEENAPIVTVSSEEAEVEVIETITKQEAMQLYGYATSLCDNDNKKGLKLLKAALVKLGLRTEDTSETELRLSEILKSDFEKIKTTIYELSK